MTDAIRMAREALEYISQLQDDKIEDAGEDLVLAILLMKVERARAALAQLDAPASVEAGWKLVPVDPTEEMVTVAWTIWRNSGGVADEDDYPVLRCCIRDAISAAPPQPALPVEKAHAHDH